MPLTPGTRLGVYEVTAQIGAGGMGEVYRARDTKLNRDVALKVLPDSFASDSDRLARFTREAQTLASLNHPHIAGIYGLEESGGVSALVMELVEGEDLSAHIARGAIPLDEALPIATQIAEALEAAQGQGIIHRDLKPANIKVRADRTVKVLDFGLAKAMEPASALSASASMSPTITTPAMTQAGVILGTAAYMSPEQAKGQEADRTADVWSFGCVLYEMLVGAPAFRGHSIGEILGEVLKSEPEWSVLPPETPSSVRRLLRRCLTKDCRLRLQHLGDARLELLDAALLDERSQAPVASSRRRWWAAVAACLGVGAGAGLMLAWKSRPVTPADRTAMPLVRVDFTLPEGVEVYSQNGPNASISPDGRDVVFTGATGGVRRLYIRHLDHEETEVLPGTETSNQCFFSPDGTAVGFLSSDRTLKRISLADHLVDVLGRDVDRFYGAAWGGDDRITYVHDGELWQVPGSGGSPTRLTTLNRAAGERMHGWPFAINHGQAILFTVVTGTRPQDAHLEAVVVAGETRHVIAESGRNPLYVPSGHLAFFRDGSFVAMPFDAARLTATGSAFKLSEDILLDTVGGMLASVSSSGALVYESTAMAASRLVLVSREGIESALPESPRFHFSPRFGPDGHTIAVQSTGGLWLVDSQRGTSTLAQGSNQSVGNSYPVWTPDGSRIVFRTSNGLQWSSVDGRGDSAAIDDTSLADIPNAVTLDGRTLIVTRQTAVTSGDIYALSIASPSKPHALVSTPAYEGGARLSPDGHWLAYSSNETGRFEVYLRPYPSLDRRWPISTQGGTQVQWRRDGRELFFRRDNQMLAVALGSQATPTPAPPRILFEQQYSYGASQTIADYDVSPDGQRFLMVKSESSRSRLNIVFGWAEELRRLERAK